MNKVRKEIPIFFSTDDNYVPFLTVALHSIVENASKEYDYKIIILNSELKEESVKQILAFENENFKVEFADVNKKIKDVAKNMTLGLRDYYSNSIYYRIFIPSLFPDYDKALYLDADIVVIDDISKLYFEELGDNLLGAITDDVVNGNDSFKKYSETVLGIKPTQYFNSGILVMNLKELRKFEIENKFVHLIGTYNFDTIAPDQDYLNYLCRGKVKYIHKGWDKMPMEDNDFSDDDLHLIHYNMFRKPWHYSEVPYEDFFWNYAKKSSYYDDLLEMKATYSDEQKRKDDLARIDLVKRSERIMDSKATFVNVLNEKYFEKV
mgnify:FL=1